MSWARMLNRWHDEVGPAHLQKDDGSPRCGASYYTSAGALPRYQHSNFCKRCLQIENSCCLNCGSKNVEHNGAMGAELIIKCMDCGHEQGPGSEI